MNCFPLTENNGFDKDAREKERSDKYRIGKTHDAISLLAAVELRNIVIQMLEWSSKDGCV